MTLRGTVDNTLLVTFFGMLWNVNFEGVRFLSFIALILKVVQGSWSSKSTALVIVHLLLNLMANMWTVGGLRFLLMPKLAPCLYDREGEVLDKAYYSTRYVTQYSAPLVWLTFALFEGTTVFDRILFPENDEELDRRVKAFWQLCYKHIYIIFGVYVTSEFIFDLISFRISQLHQKTVTGSVYRVDLPGLLTVLALINGFFLIDTFRQFTEVTENLLYQQGLMN